MKTKGGCHRGLATNEKDSLDKMSTGKKRKAKNTNVKTMLLPKAMQKGKDTLVRMNV